MGILPMHHSETHDELAKCGRTRHSVRAAIPGSEGTPDNSPAFQRRVNRHNFTKSRRDVRIPKGFRHSAQGCRALRGYPGKAEGLSTTPTGLCPPFLLDPRPSTL